MSLRARADGKTGLLVPAENGFRLKTSSFAQPSGLTTDGKNLYVADSEGHRIRILSLP